MSIRLNIARVPPVPGMKRFLVLLAIATLGFIVGSGIYVLLEPFLPSLPNFIERLLEVASQGWFIAGLIGASLAVIIILIWASSGSGDYWW